MNKQIKLCVIVPVSKIISAVLSKHGSGQITPHILQRGETALRHIVLLSSFCLSLSKGIIPESGVATKIAGPTAFSRGCGIYIFQCTNHAM